MSKYGAFSREDPRTFVLTPLGAAVVDAMPDRELMKKINLRFKRTGYCPPSRIFNEQQVAEFYSQQDASL